MHDMGLTPASLPAIQAARNMAVKEAGAYTRPLFSSISAPFV